MQAELIAQAWTAAPMLIMLCCNKVIDEHVEVPLLLPLSEGVLDDHDQTDRRTAIVAGLRASLALKSV